MDSIQTLLRKGATCSDLLSCLYNLKPIDIQIFREVSRRDQANLDQISEAVDRDRSSTHRCLSKLVSAGLVNKQTRTLKSGGYYHVYAAVEPSEIKKEAKRRVREITLALENLVDNFDVDLANRLS
jgi:predicted transcriptional regulator